jgi:hypothetical protein
LNDPGSDRVVGFGVTDVEYSGSDTIDPFRSLGCWSILFAPEHLFVKRVFNAFYK